MRLVYAALATTVISFSAGTTSALPAQNPAAQPSSISGIVLDGSGSVVPGAVVTLALASRPSTQTVTTESGRFSFRDVPPGPATVSVAVEGFSTAVVTVTDPARPSLRVVLQPAAVAERVTVSAGLATERRIASATKTDTPLRDVPQAISVVTRDLIADQGAQSVADVVRYVPGVGVAQGEGNRDAVIFRGSASTAAFLVDGLRDDVQYFRDVYNVERVEVLKGPNAMMFGQGGAGGVLNRVTRRPSWNPVRDATLQIGSFGNRRATLDLDVPLSRAVAARLTALYENSASYRLGVGVERCGLNPTVAVMLRTRTLVTAGYEHFDDRRTADRGVPSFHGSPVAAARSTFFGDPDASRSRVTVDSVFLAIEQRLGRGLVLRNHTRYAGYDKFYQNVYPGAVNATGTSVALAAYNNSTARQNIFNQTDLTVSLKTGAIQHRVLAGTELGRQATTNVRNTGYFTAFGSGVTGMDAPLLAPTVSVPLAFRQSATDADNSGVANVRAIYVQDQIALTPTVQAIAGLRYERFEVDVRNKRTGIEIGSLDRLFSPRVGIIYKPIVPVSIYTSYSLTYQPRAGEQLSSLTVNNKALAPEQFRNYEVGAKWDPRPTLSLTAAAYRLDRRNVAVPDPVNPAVSHLIDGQRMSAIELEACGRLTRGWEVAAAYAFQRGEIIRSLSPTAQAGARLAQVPRQTLSIWNRYDFSPALGAGVGITHRGAMFASTDNTVVLPGYTRIDAAVFVRFTSRVRGQLNLENVLDRRYYPFANGNNNITPGSPRALRIVLSASF